MSNFLSLQFVQNALLAGTILASIGSVLGVYTVLRRISFFSDAIAHSSLAGIAIALLMSIQPILGAVAFSIFVAILIVQFEGKKTVSVDTLIGVIFSLSIALAIFIFSLFPGLGVDVTGLLFGNILTVTQLDIWYAFALLLVTVFFISKYSKHMIMLMFNEDLAYLQYKDIQVARYFFLSLLAATIALSVKIIGAILVSALIIVPAATAQNFAKNLKQMFLISFIFAIVTVISGMYLSFLFNTPSGSSIVLLQGLGFIISLLLKD